MGYAKNKVISGDYMGAPVKSTGTYCVISCGGHGNEVAIHPATVENYMVLSGEQRKSASSGVTRGLIGGALFGAAGMVAGGLSAKNNSIYTVMIKFKDGCKSTVEVDEKLYKVMMMSLF